METAIHLRIQLRKLGAIAIIIRLSSHVGYALNDVADAICESAGHLPIRDPPVIVTSTALLLALLRVDPDADLNSISTPIYDILPAGQFNPFQLIREELSAQHHRLIITQADVKHSAERPLANWHYPIFNRRAFGLTCCITPVFIDTGLLEATRTGVFAKGGSPESLTQSAVSLMLLDGSPLLHRSMCPVCERDGTPSLWHLLMGECTLGATLFERNVP